MLIKVSDSARIIKLFTKETCLALQGMDVMERRSKLAGVLTAFFQGKLPAMQPAAEIAKEAGIDEELVQKVLMIMAQKGMTGPSDAPGVMNRNQPVTADVFYTSVLDPIASFGFEEVYDFVDMRTAGQTSFDIIDVTNAITFEEVKSGERMKTYGITTTQSTVNKMIVAAAIGILDDWINYAQFWNLNQAAIEARSKYYDKMADDHYALLAAIGAGHNQAFVASDIGTINAACANILAGCASLGYVLTGNETFVLRANPLLKSRIEMAFALTFNSLSLNPDQIVWNIERAYTTKLAATSYYVGLPGRKAKRGVWSDLSAETDRDILLRGTDVAYCGEYNAAIGEQRQFRRCALQ